MTLAETQAEYAGTVRDFPYELPGGVAFPARVPKPAESTVYQRGSGLVQAYQFWECAWMDTYLDDPASASAGDALAHLEEGTTSVYRTQYVVDDDGNWTNAALGSAKLGDPSVLSAFYDSDCVWYRAETGQ